MGGGGRIAAGVPEVELVTWARQVEDVLHEPRARAARPGEGGRPNQASEIGDLVSGIADISAFPCHLQSGGWRLKVGEGERR